MRANGNNVTVICGKSKYVFDTFRITVFNRLEDTPLIGGKLYRIRSAGVGETLYLKVKITFDEISKYRNLIKKLGENSDIAIDDMLFSGFTLISGNVTNEENAAFAQCEITLTEVAD